jgi:hypothetical protein
MELANLISQLRKEYGQAKQMGSAGASAELPHYFLLRRYLDIIDLLVILNSKRCSYRCFFCQLPAKSSPTWIYADSIKAQFAYVMREMKHALSIVERVTLSNEGSVLDASTLDTSALHDIVETCGLLPSLQSISIETRLEYVELAALGELAKRAPQARLNILTGFETQDEHVRDHILGKRESLTSFLRGLDAVAEAMCDLTAYVLYKPHPSHSDLDAYTEAAASIDFLVSHCAERKIDLTVRLNPMYASRGSRWSHESERCASYMPPRLSDVLRLAEAKRSEGIRIYLGLSTEGLAATGTYRDREDFSRQLLRRALLFNICSPSVPEVPNS